MSALANVTLEISAKPLFRKDDAFVLELFTGIFRHWWPLLKDSESVSLLWWLSDGTDILEYDGDLERRIEWGMWQGFAHRTVHAPDKDPAGASILSNPRIYRPDPVSLTYGDLRRIVGLMKQAGRDVLGKPARVGIPFDPGSEFCRSPFRYERHPELLIGSQHIRCIDATGRLAADASAFAGFPDGVPEGTPFGTFLGRQTHRYLSDLGFDFIWFSNSFGYGRSPYAFGGAGQFFDGERYAPDGNRAVSDAVLEFWRLFRTACPSGRIECRGTDFTVGMNLVNHATPYSRLYSGTFDITPPPNTPWPALTRNHGLALTGYLSQISAFRGDCFPFRYYAADPWFNNSPWMDRWERNPHDIYLSTACSRLDAEGRVQAFNDIRILTLDDSWGNVPEQIPDEVIPHLKRAVHFRPDETPPVIWVYPFEEYHRCTFEQPARIAEPMAGDVLIQHAFNHGLPMSGVATTAAFIAAQAAAPARFLGRVLVSPVPDAGSEWEAALARHAAAGGSVLYYGPAGHASAAWMAALGLAHAAPLSGEFDIELVHDLDGVRLGTAASRCHHHAAISGGGMAEVPAASGGGAEVLAWVRQSGQERVAACVRGRSAWVRGTSSVTVAGIRGRNLATADAAVFYPCEMLLRHSLASLGWQVAVDRDRPSQEATHLMISRSRNAFMMAAFSPDDSVSFRLRTPLGAPLLPGRATELVGGEARVRLSRWFHEEVRVFVEQADGTVSLHHHVAGDPLHRRRLNVGGLREATVRFFPESGCFERTSALLNADMWMMVGGDAVEPRRVDGPHGRHLEMRGVTGLLSIGWGPDDAPAPVLPAD